MLQHNSEQNLARAGQHAHVAHAAMISLHTLCCGLPVLAMAAATLSGAAAGATAFESFAGDLHGLLHEHEEWILGLSAGLVGLGGLFEWGARRQGLKRGFPVMFAVSVGCFLFNLTLIAVHRGLV